MIFCGLPSLAGVVTDPAGASPFTSDMISISKT
jgi:hypothetical protein